MIFNNFTLSEITELVFGEKGKDTTENIYLKTFYDDLKLAFESKKEKKKFMVFIKILKIIQISLVKNL
jgi:hypothetical protein